MRLPICLLAIAVSTGLMHAEDFDDQAAPAPAPAAAAAPAPAAPAPPAKFGGWVFSGLVDGYITGNQNHPQVPGLGSWNQLQNFDLFWGQPQISFAKFTIDKSDSVLGVHVDVGTGETMRLIHATDIAAQEHKSLRYFEQMYAIVKPKHAHGTEIDFGQFVTSAGAEVIESTGNWNYSRSLLFALAIPYYHFGVKVTTPVSKSVTVGFQVVNPWNQIDPGQHTFTNFAGTLGVTHGKLTWNTDYYVGPNNMTGGAQPSNGLRHLFDTTVILNPNDKFSFYLNGDYARNTNPGTNAGYTEWGGIAAAGRFQATKKIAFAARTEFFTDPQGYETGSLQRLYETTLTGEYKFNGIFMARGEWRHDNSNQNFFYRGAAATVPTLRDMTTMTLGVTASLGPWK